MYYKWQLVTPIFETKSSWRGDYPSNTTPDSGWFSRFHIPFSAFGLSGFPAEGEVWGMAVVVHDRDAINSTFIPAQTWPETVNVNQPATWGQLHFGAFQYEPPFAVAGGTVTIKNGVNGAFVEDAHVGGSTICGSEHAGNYFGSWGDYNRSGDDQINIQNQWDVADFPCFSKYYATFPLTSLPSNKEILSATLTMNQFGGAGYTDSTPPISLIQVSHVAEDWDRDTITWNNAPLAAENMAAATVGVLSEYPGWPGIERQWDVSGMVAAAYEAGEPLRLVLYSADGDYHSGKYFFSSTSGMDARPKLEITWGDPAFLLQAAPSLQHISGGETAVFDIDVNYGNGFSENVQLSTNSVSGLDISLSDNTVSPPGGSVQLIVKDMGAPTGDGKIRTITITGVGGEISTTTEVTLVVNGSQTFLPLVNTP